MKIKNTYKNRTLSELCDIIDDWTDIQDFTKTGYLGEYLIRTPEQISGEYKFYRQTIKINFNPVVRTIRFYDENNECEYKLDLLPSKDGFHYLTYAVYDDEEVDSQTEANMIRTLRLQRIKLVSTEESFFQESTVTDYGDVTFEEQQRVLDMFNYLVDALKEKYHDSIGSVTVLKNS